MRGTSRWVGVLVAAVLVACGGNRDDDEPADDAPPEKEEVVLTAETTTLTFVDSTRPTSASAEAPATDSRTLETLIAHPEPLEGRHPLIVLAHGMGGHPSRLSTLMETWAESG